MYTNTKKKMAKPKVTVRSYQVGFGDCFLVTFHLAAGDRHVLIDCGSTAPPRWAKADKDFVLGSVAEDIAKVTGGRLTAVVATHRHKDHISGFARKTDGKGAGDILRRLKPKLVVQPWTEDPTVPTDAERPKAVRHLSGKFAVGLQGMHLFAGTLRTEAKLLEATLSADVNRQLGFLGENNLANADAVKNLMTMGDEQEYLHYGSRSKLEKLLPGVKVRVLGPPTIEQYPDIRKQRSRDPSEFWHMRGLTSTAFGPTGTPPFAAEHIATGPRPQEVRWFVPRVQASRGAQLLELVRILDTAMNNTSLILLFEYKGKRLLFPGDAQIENWTHALKHAKNAKANVRLLAGTHLYKVGHHGSLNATPKSLWSLFKHKGGPDPTLHTLLSTRPGKHGRPSNRTEVPRKTLLKELQDGSKLQSTDDLKKKDLCQVLEL